MDVVGFNFDSRGKVAHQSRFSALLPNDSPAKESPTLDLIDTTAAASALSAVGHGDRQAARAA